jgi:hypothetical protein
MFFCDGLTGAAEYGWNRGQKHQEISFRQTFSRLRNGIANQHKTANKSAMKRFALLSVLIAFGLAACERHEFEGPEGTKRLHGHGESHSEHEVAH